MPAIVASWERDDFSVYGRFDFAFDSASPPKLLEYNADTPTALLEAAVVQWFWLQDTRPTSDQFNSIHERLIAAWQRWGGQALHFSAIKDHVEDEQTVLYLRDTAEQAGVATRFVHVEDIGWNGADFVDLTEAPITQCFKLYPWEWLWHEEFGAHLARETTRFIEPMWKMLLSNKGLLPILWELFPGHPNLLLPTRHPNRLAQTSSRNPNSAAKARTSPSCATAKSPRQPAATTARKVSFTRPLHHRVTSPANVRSSASGWWTMRPPASASVRTRVTSPGTSADSCPISSTER